METTAIDPRIINGQSEFIKAFFKDLKDSPDYTKLKDQPFESEAARTNLFNYLNMGVIEKYLRELRAKPLSEVDTFMSNGLEWVNGNVAYNENGVTYMDARELIHLYVNLLALLVSAPTLFMKMGALTMYSISPDTVKGWMK